MCSGIIFFLGNHHIVAFRPGCIPMFRGIELAGAATQFLVLFIRQFFTTVPASGWFLGIRLGFASRQIRNGNARGQVLTHPDHRCIGIHRLGSVPHPFGAGFQNHSRCT